MQLCVIADPSVVLVLGVLVCVRDPATTPRHLRAFAAFAFRARLKSIFSSNV